MPPPAAPRRDIVKFDAGRLPVFLLFFLMFFFVAIQPSYRAIPLPPTCSCCRAVSSTSQ
jgi:hypothetical protein